MSTLSTGNWVTAARLKVYPAMMLVLMLAGIVAYLATSTGMRDSQKNPIGTDFSQVWIAGTEVNTGHPEAPFYNEKHFPAQRAFFGEDTPIFGWHYPPFFLALASFLALFPYLMALAIWQFATLPLYAWAVVRITRLTKATEALDTRHVLIAALAFPAVLVNLAHGHNGFLTAALLAGGLLCLQKRPILAGVLFALLAYKPQFALVIPVALLAGAHWRTILSAIVTGVAMTVATLLAYGVDTWWAFKHSTIFTREVILEQGATGWYKIQSIFSAVRMLGGSVNEAYLVQGVATALVLAAVFWLWRSKADFRLKAAALMVASLLTTPYCLDYDLMLLGPALAFMVAHGMEKGFVPYEKTLLVLVWTAPIIARPIAFFAFLPFGVLVMLAMFYVILSRAAAETGATRLISGQVAAA